MPSKSHGESKTRLYRVWKGMRERCQNHNHIAYPDYGGRGISVCEEWDKDYLAFKEWAIKNGYDETAKRNVCTLDRIDVNGNYCPENCRFADALEQSLNKRTTVKINYNGNLYNFKELSDITGVDIDLLRSRYWRGLSVEEMLKPKEKEPLKIKYDGIEYKNPYDLGRHLGINPRTLSERLHRGLTLEQALSDTLPECGEMYEYNGEKHNLKQWAKKLGINFITLYARVKRYGWSLEDALSVPIDETCKKKREMTEEEKQIVLNSDESAKVLSEKFGFSIYSVYKVRNENKKERGVAS